MFYPPKNQHKNLIFFLFFSYSSEDFIDNVCYNQKVTPIHPAPSFHMFSKKNEEDDKLSSKTPPSTGQLRPRSVARLACVQLFYGFKFSTKPFSEFLEMFCQQKIFYDKFFWIWKERHFIDLQFFLNLSNSMHIHNLEAKKYIEKYLSQKWPYSSLNMLSRIILHLGATEILFHEDIPWKTSVNESVNMAHLFLMEEKAPGFINGILDKISQEKYNLPEKNFQKNQKKYSKNIQKTDSVLNLEPVSIKELSGI